MRPDPEHLRQCLETLLLALGKEDAHQVQWLKDWRFEVQALGWSSTGALARVWWLQSAGEEAEALVLVDAARQHPGVFACTAPELGVC